MPQFYRTPNKIIDFWDRRVMTQENQDDLNQYSSAASNDGVVNSQKALDNVSAGGDINVGINQTQNQTQNINIHYYLQPSSNQTTSAAPVNSSGNHQIYIERPSIEQDCYEAIEYERLIRIKAPPRMGKTWLLNKVIEYAKETKHYSIVEIDIDEDILTKGHYIGFLHWFCLRLSDSLNFPRVSWDKDNGNKLNVINHIISILSTSRVDSKLIITISNFEVLFEFPDIFRRFCELVRGWVDSNDRSLRKLSVIIVHSTEPYIRYNINSSPFGNVGKPFELLGFTNEQVETLANRLSLESLVNNHSSEIKQLQKFVNGHPELITKALKCIKNGADIQDILKDASTEGGIFGSHLRDKQNNLRQKTNLLEDYKKIVVNYCEPNRTSTKLDSNLIFQLYGLGLVKYNGNGCWPSCELYHSYFYDILIKNKQ